VKIGFIHYVSRCQTLKLRDWKVNNGSVISARNAYAHKINFLGRIEQISKGRSRIIRNSTPSRKKNEKIMNDRD
jgi:hypothetical protein